MSMPPVTLILLLLGLILFLNGKANHLAYLASISFIFHNAFISTFGALIRPNQLIYLLFVLLMIIFLVSSNKHSITFNKKYDKPLTFCIYSIPASILANVISTGELVISPSSSGFGSDVQTQINDLVPITIDTGLLTQNIYVIFPMIVYFFLRKLDVEILKKCVDCFIYAVAFLTIWNIINIIEIIVINGSSMTNITHYLVGREGGIGTTTGVSGMSRGFARIGGFVGEPSHYAYMVLPAFGYVMGMGITDKKNNIKWNLFSLLFLIGLVISFSTAGFVSFILFMIIYSIYNYKKKIFLYLLLLSIPIILTAYLILGEFINAFLQYNLAKITSGEGSFAIRLWSIKHNLMLLLNYPLLGIGIGSGRALGGVVTVLSNIGIVGVIVLYFCFREIFPIYSKSIIFALYALFIHNLITGDLSTFFSPTFSLLLAYASNNNLVRSRSTKLTIS